MALANGTHEGHMDDDAAWEQLAAEIQKQEAEQGAAGGEGGKPALACGAGAEPAQQGAAPEAAAADSLQAAMQEAAMEGEGRQALHMGCAAGRRLHAHVLDCGGMRGSLTAPAALACLAEDEPAAPASNWTAAQQQEGAPAGGNRFQGMKLSVPA